VRKRLRKAGLTTGVTVVFSDEPARPASLALTQQQYKRSYFGTCSWMPALFGLHIAAHIVREVADGGAYRGPARGAAAMAQAAAAVRGRPSAQDRPQGKAGRPQQQRPQRHQGQQPQGRGQEGQEGRRPAGAAVAGAGDARQARGPAPPSQQQQAVGQPGARPSAQQDQQGAAAAPGLINLDRWRNCAGVGVGLDGSGI
jgi:hypothetical protein